VAGLSRNYLVGSVAPFLLSGLCSSACQRHTTSAPPAAPGATAESVKTVPSTQVQTPSSGKDDDRKPRSVSPTTRSFAVYSLSRGTGVPPEASEAQLKVQKLAEADRARGVTVSIETTRIGIEGERRLCVAYRDSRNAARALARARVIVKGIGLVNLVVEPCTPAPSKIQKKEERS
jgi:hypothetical protein